MALSDEEEELIESILTALSESNSLRGWDKTFIDDLTTKFEELGREMWVSPRQWVQIHRIGRAYGVPGCQEDTI